MICTCNPKCKHNCSKSDKIDPLTNDKIKDFWIGPYGIKIAGSIYSVMAVDDINTVDKDGSVTCLISFNRLSREQYLDKYGEIRDDGSFWYKN
jgi:hypothetical protein